MPLKDRESKRAYDKVYNASRRDSRNEARRVRRSVDPAATHRSDRRSYIRRYGITLEDFNQMMKDQDGKCAICSLNHDGGHIDHSHVSGVVRGILCGMCNRGLGHFLDNPDLLRLAAEYLDKANLLRGQAWVGYGVS